MVGVGKRLSIAASNFACIHGYSLCLEWIIEGIFSNQLINVQNQFQSSKQCIVNQHRKWKMGHLFVCCMLLSWISSSLPNPRSFFKNDNLKVLIVISCEFYTASSGTTFMTCCSSHMEAVRSVHKLWFINSHLWFTKSHSPNVNIMFCTNQKRQDLWLLCLEFIVAAAAITFTLSL